MKKNGFIIDDFTMISDSIQKKKKVKLNENKKINRISKEQKKQRGG